MGGSPPKRDAERMRDLHRKTSARSNKTTHVSYKDHEFLCDEVEIPESDPGWHPIAKRWFDSLRQSGQHVYYEPSDWAAAVVLAESLSRDLKPQYVAMTHPAAGSGDKSEPVYETIPLRAAAISAYFSAMGRLLVTEGSRRQVAVEIERQRLTSTLPPVLTLAKSREEALADDDEPE